VKAKRMAYLRAKSDPILLAVISEINKTAVKPDPGFLKVEDWAERWQMTPGRATDYIKRAVSSGILVVRKFRVITKGRLRVLTHYGVPDIKPSHLVRHRRRP